MVSTSVFGVTSKVLKPVTSHAIPSASDAVTVYPAVSPAMIESLAELMATLTATPCVTTAVLVSDCPDAVAQT
jgi:hypothetical protein